MKIGKIVKTGVAPRRKALKAGEKPDLRELPIPVEIPKKVKKKEKVPVEAELGFRLNWRLYTGVDYAKSNLYINASA